MPRPSRRIPSSYGTAKASVGKPLRDLLAEKGVGAETRKAAEFGLPWPPSVNTYWRHVGAKVLISAKGREYRREVENALRGVAMTAGRLAVEIVAFPPDRRKRDLDNLLKAALDAVTHSGVWEDDGQIDSLSIHRGEVTEGGWLSVKVRAL